MLALFSLSLLLPLFRPLTRLLCLLLPQVRRLYDIANVLCTIKMIRKVRREERERRRERERRKERTREREEWRGGDGEGVRGRGRENSHSVACGRFVWWYES